MKKPKTAPEWIWRDWCIVRERALAEAPIVGVESTNLRIRLCEKTLASDNCACVWRAIDKRTAKGWKDTHGEVMGSFFRTVIGCVEGPLDSELIPAKSRKQVGARIIRHARSLRRELGKIAPNDRDILQPLEFGLALVESARYIGDQFVKLIEKSDLPTELDHRELRAAVKVAIGVSGIRGLLQGIERGAEVWGRSRPPVTKGAKNAKRLYFIRGATGFFRSRYGSPLHFATAALTNCIFGSSLDAQDIRNFDKSTPPESFKIVAVDREVE